MTIKASDMRVELRMDRALYAQLRAEAQDAGSPVNTFLLRLIALGRAAHQAGSEPPTRAAARELIARLEREYAE